MRTFHRTIGVVGAALAGIVGLRAAATIPESGLASASCDDNPATLHAQLSDMPDPGALLFGAAPLEAAEACSERAEAPGCSPAPLPRLLHGSTAGAERFRSPAATGAPNG